MMSWVLDGKVHVISIADREKTEIAPGRIPISTRNVYPSRLMEDVYAEASSILQKVASYTQQKEGALSMQFFWNLVSRFRSVRSPDVFSAMSMN